MAANTQDIKSSSFTAYTQLITSNPHLAGCYRCFIPHAGSWLSSPPAQVWELGLSCYHTRRVSSKVVVQPSLSLASPLSPVSPAALSARHVVGSSPLWGAPRWLPATLWTPSPIHSVQNTTKPNQKQLDRGTMTTQPTACIWSVQSDKF